MLNKENQRATRIRWRETHIEERRAWEARWRQGHKENQKQTARNYNRKLKLEVMTHYSIEICPVCANCGITDIDVLCIDHINGGGSDKRRRGLEKGGQRFYIQLRKQAYPTGFQVLCSNCNLKKLIVEGK